jgi:hypothetical protein
MQMDEYKLLAAGAAPDDAVRTACLSIAIFGLLGVPRRHAHLTYLLTYLLTCLLACLLGVPRRHALPEFDWDALVGADGQRCHEVLQNYTFESVWPAALGLPMRFDITSWGLEAFGLLVRWGDLAGARASWTLTLDAHRRIRTMFEAGAVAVQDEVYNIWHFCKNLCQTALMAGEMPLLCEAIASTMLPLVKPY